MGLNLIYWTAMDDKCALVGSNLGKCGNYGFSGWIWPDWGNTARVDMARLGSIGLYYPCHFLCHKD